LEKEKKVRLSQQEGSGARPDLLRELGLEIVSLLLWPVEDGNAEGGTPASQFLDPCTEDCEERAARRRDVVLPPLISNRKALKDR